MKRKVLVVGIDGASWNVISDGIKRNKLPTFKEFIQHGTIAKLRSTLPPQSPPAWESIATGKRPEKIGFIDFWIKEGYELKFWFQKRIDVLRIWDILSAEGFRSLAANVPSLVRPYPINGYLICGFCAKEGEITYPPELLNELHRICGMYEIDSRFDMKSRDVALKWEVSVKGFARVSELFRKRVKIFQYLLEKYKWDFAFLVFTLLDRVQHWWWKYRGLILDFYQKVDEAITKLMSLWKDANIILVSDHGFMGTKYVFNANKLLMDHGFFKPKRNVRIPIFVNVLLKFAREFPFYSEIRSLLKPKIGRRTHQFTKRALMGRKAESITADWEKTIAYCVGRSGTVYLNVKGREPCGVVDPKEYYEVRERVANLLKYVRQGRKVFKIKVYKKEEIYEGSDLWDNLPDLVIECSEDSVQFVADQCTIFNPYIDYDPRREWGWHSRYGIFMAMGPDVEEGRDLGIINAWDVAPTILHMYGLAIPKDMDGKVLVQIFREGSPCRREPSFVDPAYYKKKVEQMRVREAIKRRFSSP